jgi:hypothetical protein
MAQTIESLAGAIREQLQARPGAEGRAACCRLVEQALADPEFVEATFVGRAAPREVVYEDPELGFCICAHVLEGEASGGPHDHGPSWAIYAQVEGTTEMTDWRVVKPAEGDEPAVVEPAITYTLRPGQAHFYDVGAVHSPKRVGSTRLLRIEGQNLAAIGRTRFRAA